MSPNRAGKYRRIPVMALIAGSVLTLTGSQAQAGLSWWQYDRIQDHISTSTESINKRIDALDRNVIGTIKKATAQTSLYIQQLGTLETKLAQGAQNQEAQLERQKKRAEIARDVLPQKSACDHITGLAGLAAVETHTSEESRITVTDRVGRLAQNTGKGPVGQAASAAERVKALTPYQPNQCKNTDADAFLNGKASCLLNADINPLSLLGKPTLDNKALIEASAAFIDNLVDPVDENPLPADALSSHGARLDYLDQRSRLARRALAYSTLLSMRADRTQAVKLGDWANALLPEEMKRGENISRDDLYRILASDYFLRPNYFTELQGMTPANLQREAVRNQAVSLMISWQRLKQQKTTNMLLAALLAQGTERIRHPSAMSTSTAPVSP